MSSPQISVVVPTHERPDLLARCLDRVLTQETERPYEVVVVNDGPALPRLPPLDDPRVVVLESGRRGPAVARNRGAEEARAPVVLFTDDDALPDAGWLEAAASALEAEPDAVGAEGPTIGTPFDPLYEHTVHNERPSAYFTCNIAYRRADFLASGGFDTGFPSPHCEDVDLGRRIARRGSILFVDSMRIVHPPRPIGFWEVVRRGRLVESEWRLHRKHPETTPARWPLRWGPLIRLARRWQRLLVDPVVVRGSGRRAARALGLAAGQFAVALYTTLTRWAAER